MRRILLIGPSPLEEVVLASAIPSFLKRCWPESQISWLLETPLAELVASHPGVDALLTFSRQEWQSLWREGQWLELARQLLGLLGEVGWRRFDLALLLERSPRPGAPGPPRLLQAARPGRGAVSDRDCLQGALPVVRRPLPPPPRPARDRLSRLPPPALPLGAGREGGRSPPQAAAAEPEALRPPRSRHPPPPLEPAGPPPL